MPSLFVKIIWGALIAICPLLVLANGYPNVSIVGDGTVVYNYSSQKCDDIDIPDAALRAFRRNDGKIVAFASHYRNRQFAGNSLGELTHSCSISYEGKENADAGAFDDRTWISSTWTGDGKNVVALGHNEYQAQRFPGRCKFNTYTQCWYNSIVLLSSGNGGTSFERVDHDSPMPLAAAPQKADSYAGHPSGYFEPSNIVEFNQQFYVLIGQKGLDSNKNGRCLFRTSDTSTLSQWTYFDGHQFQPSASNPYKGQQGHTLCEPVKGLEGFLGSIARIDGTDTFAAFTIDETPDGQGALKVSFSEDLFNWKATKTIAAFTPFWSRSCPSKFRYDYPSVVDDGSQSRNFETIGSDPYLFIVRGGCDLSMNRDLVRFKLHLDIKK